MATLAVGSVLVKLTLVPVAGQAQAAAKAGPAPKTSWGEPDLQGIWTDEFQSPLQRPAKYAGREFFTDAERAAIDAKRASKLDHDFRAERSHCTHTGTDISSRAHTT